MQDQTNVKPVILIILDGLGHSPIHHGNAIEQAYTPNLKFLWDKFPKTLLNASGHYVGLPKNQMGNSEVGHTTIGSGRVINQDLVRISQSIYDKTFFNNYLLNYIYRGTKRQKKKIHIIGLCSDGGVHSHIKHLFALINISKKYNKVETCLHIITDGRDTNPQYAKVFINQILEIIKNEPYVKICTISGRYYSMDRECRWTRIEKTYRCLIQNTIVKDYWNNPIKLIDSSYSNSVFDEFIIPTRINKGKIEDGDSLIFFNFRPDRMKQLVKIFTSTSFKGFRVKKFKSLYISTFTIYDSKLNVPIIFPKTRVHSFLGQIISENSLKQFRITETEKYTHVTYFFNGGQEDAYYGEDRELIPSPSVDCYNSIPEMSSKKITQKLIRTVRNNTYKFIVVNYANVDMLGDTGNFKATKQSIEIIDQYIGKVLKENCSRQATIVITADHGNAEEMLDINNQPCKSHTSNAIPFILVDSHSINIMQEIKTNILKPSGSLQDIAPTILDLLNLKIPESMSGVSLFNQQYKNRKDSSLFDKFYNK